MTASDSSTTVSWDAASAGFGRPSATTAPARLPASIWRLVRLKRDTRTSRTFRYQDFLKSSSGSDGREITFPDLRRDFLHEKFYRAAGELGRHGAGPEADENAADAGFLEAGKV